MKIFLDLNVFQYIPLDIIYKLIIFFVIIVATWLIVIIIDKILKQLLSGTFPAVSASIRRVVGIFIWILGSLIALSQVGLNLEILLLVVALAGIGAIISMRHVLENLVGKYFSDAYIPFNRGDIIRVGNYEGEVIEINPIATILLNEKGEMISIPNSIFMKEISVNLSPTAWKKVTIPIVLSSDINFAEFENLLMKYMFKIKHLLDEHFQPIINIKSKSPTSIEALLIFMINDKNKKDLIVNQVNTKISEIIDTLKKKKK
jgi:small conductance mechanosensitive channel